MTNTILIAVIAVIVIALIGLVIAYKYVSKHAKENAFAVEDSKDDIGAKIFTGFYRFFSITPVLRKYLRKIKRKVRGLFPADEKTINSIAGKEMLKNFLLVVGIMVVVVIMCKGNFLYTAVGLAGAYILFMSRINSSTEALEMKLLDQLDECIDDLMANYHSTRDVVSSIELTLEGLPYEISLHIRRIYQIVTSTDADYELEQYIQTAPNRFLLLLAAICNSINECGDKDVDGQSLFLKSLVNVKNELNQERLTLIDRQNAFAGKTVGCLLPLFMLKPIESLMVSSISDLSNFYYGSGGVVTIAILVVLNIVVFERLQIEKETGKTSSLADEEESGLFSRIAEIGFVKRFLVLRANKNYTKTLRLTEDLRDTASVDTINTFTIKRYVWGMCFALAGIALCIYANAMGKSTIFKDFAEAYSQELVPNEEYRETMQEISSDLSKSAKKTDTDNMEELVSEYVEENDLDERMTASITSELTERKKEYDSYYFRWWFLLIGVAAAMVGYYIPLMLLKVKKSVMSIKRDEEVAQFKTVIAILMHQDGMQLDEVLIWLERFSTVYRIPLKECLMNFEWNQTKALDELKEAEGNFVPFKRLVDNLKSVDEVGLEDAFNSLESDRDFENQSRARKSHEILKKAEGKANLLMMIPIYGLAVLQIGVPFGIYIINMLKEINF